MTGEAAAGRSAEDAQGAILPLYLYDPDGDLIGACEYRNDAEKI